MSTPQPALGRIPLPGIKEKIPARYMATKKPAVGIEYRYWNLRSDRMLDQGGTSTCVGHGFYHNALCGPVVVKPPKDVTPYTLYSRAQQLDPWPGQEPSYYGTSVEAGAQAAREAGLLKEFHWAFDTETALNWLLTTGPLVVGFNWYRGMFTPHEDTEIVDVEGPNEGGHCFLINGINRKTGLLRCPNSWGLKWGRIGSFYLRIAGFDRLLKEEGECCMSVEK